MTISGAIGLLAALIGSTATLLTAWAYIRSHRPPKGELFRALCFIIIIMVCILGLAVLISRSTITVNGQNTVPSLPAPGSGAPSGTTPTATPTLSPTPTLTPSPSPSLTPSPTLAPSPTLVPSPTIAPSSSPTSKKK